MSSENDSLQLTVKNNISKRPSNWSITYYNSFFPICLNFFKCKNTLHMMTSSNIQFYDCINKPFFVLKFISIPIFSIYIFFTYKNEQKEYVNKNNTILNTILKIGLQTKFQILTYSPNLLI